MSNDLDVIGGRFQFAASGVTPMKHLVLLASVLALSLLAVTPAVSQAKGSTSVGCAYTAHQGPMGMLEVAAAPGASYMAWNTDGAIVASGVMSEPTHAMPVWTSGPDPMGIILHVQIGESHFALGIDDNGWVFE